MGDVVNFNSDPKKHDMRLRVHTKAVGREFEFDIFLEMAEIVKYLEEGVSRLEPRGSYSIQKGSAIVMTGITMTDAGMRIGFRTIAAEITVHSEG